LTSLPLSDNWRKISTGTQPRRRVTMITRFTQVVKRTGAIVPFTPERITNAIYRAAVAVGGHDRKIAEGLTEQVIALMEQQLPSDHIPAVEDPGYCRSLDRNITPGYGIISLPRRTPRPPGQRRGSQTVGQYPWRKIWYEPTGPGRGFTAWTR
jgi:uridine kinase